MSNIVLLLLLFLLSCRNQPDTAVEFVEDIDRAVMLACIERDGSDMPGSVTELSRLGDSAAVALFRDARTILLLDPSLRVQRRVELAQDGPHCVEDPVSVIASADSLLIADGEGEQLAVFDWSGRKRQGVKTDFAPLQMLQTSNGIAVAPMVMGRFPGTLLFRWQQNGVVREEVPVVDFPDLTTKAIGNRVRLLPSGDGIILLHQFFTPRAVHVSPRGQRLLPVPLATAQKRAIGYVPPLPLNDEALAPALVVANDATVGDGGDFLLLVRTGRSAGDRFEKAILRTDSLLGFKAAYRIGSSPGAMTYLPRTRTLVLVDEEDRWFTCQLP